MAPQVGLEPTTTRLTAECSAIELLRNIRIRRRPTLPGRCQPSTIGAEGLNFCVRYGYRCDPFAIATGNCNYLIHACHSSIFILSCQALFVSTLTTAHNLNMINFRPSQLISFNLALNQALDLLVSSSYIHYCTSTDDLSTW